MSAENQEIVQFPTEAYAKMDAAAKSHNSDSPEAHAWRFDHNSHFDQAEGAYLAHQLTHMRKGIYAVQYPALKAKNLMPFNTTEIDTGAEQIKVEITDYFGEVKVTKGMSDDVPMADVSVAEGNQAIFSMQNAYRYSIQEARAGIMARRPLSPRKALAVKELMERKLDDVAFVGITEVGLKGLANQSGTTVYTLASTGTGGTLTWSTKSPDDILLDMNGAANKCVVDTNEVEIPDTMLLTIAAKQQISSRRMGDGTSATILRQFLDNSDYIQRIETSNKLTSNSGWTGQRGICYRNDPSRLEVMVSQPFEQFPPQAQGLHVVTLCHLRTAGLALYKPKSVTYFDGM